MRLPSDFEGGMLLFIAAVAITIIELQIVKKANFSIFSIFKAKSPAEFACLGVGGKWYPNSDSNDPCCMLPANVKEIDVDGVPICLGKLA